MGIFRELSFVLSSAITFIFNLSISSGIMPNRLKMANVVPIPKCRNPSMLKEYRPISLLPVISKVLERLVSRKFILPHIRSQLNPNQFAYIPGSSSGTTTALTIMSHKILQFLDASSGAVRLLTIDFSRAFDCARHDMIVASAKNYSVPYFLLNWITSFLTNRQQRVLWQGNFSNWSLVRSGVPQGSVLGPILFCLLVDNFTPVAPNSTVIKYADDITILHFVRSPHDDLLQLEWENCVSWSETNFLPINAAKCKVLDIVTKQNLLLSPVHFSNGSCLPNVCDLKILGVTFSSSLKWNCHLQEVIRKASQRIFIVRNLKRSDCPSQLIFRAYVAFIRSLLLYAFPCFCNIPLYLKNRMLSVEKRVLRIIGVDVTEASLLEAGDKMCVSLFEKVVKNRDHPLRSFFLEKPVTRSSCLTLQPPLAKSKRYFNSFIKYSRHI